MRGSFDPPGSGRIPQESEGATTGGPTVNTQAQQAEQSNQVQGEQYASAQQAAAVAAINAYLKANPSPNAQAAPLQAPNAQSPATIGGGSFGGAAGGQTSRPPMPPPQPPVRPPQTVVQPQAQAPPPQASAPPTQGQPPASQLTPAQMLALVAQLRGQGGGAPTQPPRMLAQ
jgi:hypothetical protein